MPETWRLAWGRGEIVLDGDRLTVRRRKRTQVIDLATASATLLRWTYSKRLVAGAAIAFDTAPAVTIAGAHTPSGVAFAGSTGKPTAIMRPDDWKQLYAAVVERIGDRIPTTAPASAAPAEFELVPKTARATVLMCAMFPVSALTMMIPAGIKDGLVLGSVGAAVALAATLAGTWWLAQRTVALRLTIDGDALVLTDGRRTWRGDRSGLRGESGHVVTTGRFGGSRTPGIAFHVGERRVLVQSMQATPTRGPALRGWAFLVPGDELERLQRLLRLR